MVAGSQQSDQDFTSSYSKATPAASFHNEVTATRSFDFVPAQISIDCVLGKLETGLAFIGAAQLLKIFHDTTGFAELCVAKKSDPMRATNSLDSRRCFANCSNGVGHCHVNRVGAQRPAWIPFQAAALALSHTLNASFRNRLNVSLLHK